MMEQMPSGVPVPEKKPALDEAWYRRYEKAGAFQAYEYLDGDKKFREEQRAAFEKGDVRNPTLDYPRIDEKVLDGRETELRQLKKEILASERNDVVKQAYRWRINEKLAEVGILRATKENSMRKFSRYTSYIYGEPSPDIFAFTVNEIRENAHKALQSENPDEKIAAQDLLASLPTMKSETERPLPQSSIIDRVKHASEQVLNALRGRQETNEPVGEIDAQGIFDMFNQAITTLKAEGWNVIIDKSSKSGISVDQEKKTVKIPESRKVTYEKLQGLVVHEIGTHVARRVQGERSKLMLLGLGLDRYEQGEEGVTTMREQSLSKEGVKNFAGLELHLAVGLARGIDGQKRDFRDVHDILLKHHTLKGIQEKKKPEDAKTSAWNQTVRVFRGTDCATPGTAFTKDMIYREGNIATWEAIGKNPDELVRLNVGKYDPSNDRHTWVLTQLGITDEDLATLES